MASLIPRGPSRLVVLWHRIPVNRQIQICFEWQARWPRKWGIECYDGTTLSARVSGLPWSTVYEFLKEMYDKAAGNLPAWFLLVNEHLRRTEGGVSN